jgi:hypothetical protein
VKGEQDAFSHCKHSLFPDLILSFEKIKKKMAPKLKKIPRSPPKKLFFGLKRKFLTAGTITESTWPAS